MTENKFNCVVCKDPCDEEKGTFDSQLDGLLCPECGLNVVLAQKYLRVEKVTRPVNVGDVSVHNHKRFEML